MKYLRPMVTVTSSEISTINDPAIKSSQFVVLEGLHGLVDNRDFLKVDH